MNWITDFVKPKVRAIIKKKEIPDDLWSKCSSCSHMLFSRDLRDNLYVCQYCEHHMPVSARKRFQFLFDDHTYRLLPTLFKQKDPLKFKDTKKYTDRLKEYRQKTKEEDAVLAAQGLIKGQEVVVSVFDFSFIGGSLGLAAGDMFYRGAEEALKKNCPYLVVTASGGARMQEGIFSLMQMPKTTVAVARLKEAKLPYITLLTHPTMGGVTASFAMLGDISLAEPGAIIGFTGPRVIKETIRQTLPENFQRAEYLQEHGMVDMVVHRRDLPERLGHLLSALSRK